jgi:hypothetical protein
MHHLTNSLTYIHQWQTYVMSFRLQQTISGLPVIKRISFYYKCLPRVYQDCCPNVGPSNGVSTLALGRLVSHVERVFCCAELFTLGFHVAMSMVFCAFVRRIIAVIESHFNGFRGKPGGRPTDRLRSLHCDLSTVCR